jgi:hypothetical protein
MAPDILLLAMLILHPRFADTTIARLSYEMLSRAGAMDDLEHAAFIIHPPDGVPHLLHWPRGVFHAAAWAGPLPEHVVAVIHTHPRRNPLPSAQDRAEARRLRLPFYVVSRAALCVAHFTGSVACAGRTPWLERNGMIGEIALHWSERAA